MNFKFELEIFILQLFFLLCVVIKLTHHQGWHEKITAALVLLTSFCENSKTENFSFHSNCFRFNRAFIEVFVFNQIFSRFQSRKLGLNLKVYWRRKPLSRFESFKRSLFECGEVKKLQKIKFTTRVNGSRSNCNWQLNWWLSCSHQQLLDRRCWKHCW